MNRDVTLTSAQYDICWADLDLGEHVYPLLIRSHGQTYEERDHFRRRVYQQLGARDLARGERLEPELHDALTLLARAPIWVDMHWLAEPGQIRTDRAVAAQSGEHGLVARLDPAGLHLMPCRGTSLLATLIDQLPTVPAAAGQSITLPRTALAPSQPAGVYDTGPAASGPVRTLEAVLARPRLRGGQIVANVRDRTGKRHRCRPVEWFDTEVGRWTARLQPTTDGTEHLTVAPANSARIATQVAETLDLLMR
ncbi:MAG TPA: ESX secretion-associated protein EspG [Pseudonocardiaceae bacterium]|nr:ESX secretion-associated protein EspG [Pseudonocardiaceae bacterium]